jgi:hypothetical protein
VYQHFRDDNLFVSRYLNFLEIKMLTLVLLDGFLDGFTKFQLFTVENCILIRLFKYFTKIIGSAGLAYATSVNATGSSRVSDPDPDPHGSALI